MDTNVLLRLTKRDDPWHQIVDTAMAKLVADGVTLCYTHQNIAELWNVMTRPKERNGLGLSCEKAEGDVLNIEVGMKLLVETEAVYRQWRLLVMTHSISGAQVYDARLAASMYVHGVEHILTLNTSDFARFSGLTALHPSSVS